MNMPTVRWSFRSRCRFPSRKVVFAKFLSGTTLILVALLFTMPFPATLAYLGSPDWGMVAAGYVAAFLLLAYFYSIALAVTAMLGDGISSYIAGVVVIFVLMLGGSDELTSLVADVIPFDWTLGLHAAFPGPHYRSLTSGFLEWRDVSWFVIAIVSLLVCCSMVIDKRRDGRTGPRSKLRLAGRLIAVFAAAALIQLASSQVPLEADLTEQDDFTLSDSTLATLQGLDGVVGIEFYWSKSEESVPQPIRNHADKALKFLRRVERAAGGRVEISRIDPAPDTDAELKALEDGIRVIPMTSGDYFFLGLRISHAGKQYTIPYLDAERAGLLEYDLLATLLRFVSGRTRFHWNHQSADTPEYTGCAAPRTFIHTGVETPCTMSVSSRFFRNPCPLIWMSCLCSREPSSSVGCYGPSTSSSCRGER